MDEKPSIRKRLAGGEAVPVWLWLLHERAKHGEEMQAQAQGAGVRYPVVELLELYRGVEDLYGQLATAQARADAAEKRVEALGKVARGLLEAYEAWEQMNDLDPDNFADWTPIEDGFEGLKAALDATKEGTNEQA